MHNKAKAVAIVQARMGSTRLPGKVMRKIMGRTVLEHVIRRVRGSQLVDEIVVATTESSSDNVIVEEAQRCGVLTFRGSEDDVLSRYYFSAKEVSAETVVRITSDCPLIDPFIMDQVVALFFRENADFASNTRKPRCPLGLDTEVFTFDSLEKAHFHAKEARQREHVTPYIFGNPQVFKVVQLENSRDYSFYRWTLDTADDFKLIEKVYRHLYKEDRIFYFPEILCLFEKHPELIKINAHVKQKG